MFFSDRVLCSGSTTYIVHNFVLPVCPPWMEICCLQWWRKPVYIPYKDPVRTAIPFWHRGSHPGNGNRKQCSSYCANQKTLYTHTRARAESIRYDSYSSNYFTEKKIISRTGKHIISASVILGLKTNGASVAARTGLYNVPTPRLQQSSIYKAIKTT